MKTWNSVALTLLAFAVVATAQVASPPSSWSQDSKQNAEDVVATEINALRVANHLPPLTRVSPSAEDKELVCTAALTGKSVRDPMFADLFTYVTSDFSARTEVLTDIALSPSWEKRKFERLSIVVEKNPEIKEGEVTYTVGLARRPSSLREFFSPFGCDVPFKCDSWKKQVVAACRNTAD